MGKAATIGLALIAISALAACVTNIQSKSAELCAPIAASDPSGYTDCVSQMAAQLDAKNRRSAAILGAALGGAAQASGPIAPERPRGFLKGSFVSGTNRVCVYNVMGSDRYVTLRSVDICPIGN